LDETDVVSARRQLPRRLTAGEATADDREAGHGYSSFFVRRVVDLRVVPEDAPTFRRVPPPRTPAPLPPLLRSAGEVVGPPAGSSSPSAPSVYSDAHCGQRRNSPRAFVDFFTTNGELQFGHGFATGSSQVDQSQSG